MYLYLRDWALDSPFLGGTTPIVRDGRHVPDSAYHDPHGLERPNGRLPTSTRSFYVDFHLSEPVLHAPARYPLGGTLGGKGRSLSRSLKSNSSRTSHGDDVSLRIRQRDYRIVEGRLDVRTSLGDGLALSSSWSGLSSCHKEPPSTSWWPVGGDRLRSAWCLAWPWRWSGFAVREPADRGDGGNRGSCRCR